MRGYHTIIAILILSAAAPTSAQTPQSAPGTSIAIPSEVGTFRMTAVHRYPDPGLGVLYRFRNDSALRPDVYVYPSGGPDGTTSLNPAREEGMNFGAVLTAQRRRGRITSFQILDSSAREYIAGSDTVPGWHVHAVLEGSEGKRDTHLYLYSVRGQMLKVRATAPEGTVDHASIDDFVAALLHAVSEENGWARR